jgi:hypothetical protein
MESPIILTPSSTVLARLTDHVNGLEKTIHSLLRERDEVRRMYCREMADTLSTYRSPEDIAADRNWDCFINKEN